MRNYYADLGLHDHRVPESVIRERYKRLALKHRPDKGGDPDKMAVVSEAHAVLADPKAREVYDQAMRELYDAKQTENFLLIAFGLSAIVNAVCVGAGVAYVATRIVRRVWR